MPCMRRKLLAVTAVGALVSLTACNNESATPETSGADASGQTSTASEVHTYTVRGKIVSVPSAERPVDDLQIHHEAIPDFKHADNVVHGMKSMTMPFPVGESVSLEGIEVGDIVEFTFTTVWGEHYPEYSVTKIVELPADTELNFGG